MELGGLAQQQCQTTTKARPLLWLARAITTVVNVESSNQVRPSCILVLRSADSCSLPQRDGAHETRRIVAVFKGTVTSLAGRRQANKSNEKVRSETSTKTLKLKNLRDIFRVGEQAVLPFLLPPESLGMGMMKRKGAKMSLPNLLPNRQAFSLRHVTTLSNSVYVWWVVCLLGAGVYAWVDRHAMNPDGLSYLDMALESLKSGPTNLINGLWSPLYPALISATLSILRPAPANVFPVVHLTNVLIFWVTLLCFTFFVRSWSAVQQDEGANQQGETPYLVPFCFGIFLWFTMEFTPASNERPDLCVTAIVFLIAALCCRMSLGPQWRYFLALGLALGLGYYAKSIMFPLALILLVVLFALPPPGKGARLKVASAALTFLIVAAPLALLVSKRVGHLSIGEAGPINYAMNVNGLPGPPSWVPGVNGTPEHPPRTILSKPIILEFAAPVKGTNPLGYDPSYWFAGARPHFDFRQQWAAIKINLHSYLGFLLEMVAIVSGTLMLYFLSPRGSLRRRPGNHFWWFTLWPAAACGMYALVHVEARYLTGFLVLLSLALYVFLWQKVDRVARTAVLGTVLFALLIPTLKDVAKKSLERTTDKPEYIRVGEALRAAGIGPGDSLAVAGGSTWESAGRVYRVTSAFSAYYARYVGARVIAAIVDADDGKDMPQRQAPEFWHIGTEDLARVKDVLAGIRVKAIVALDRPADSTPADWRQVSGTSYSILLLRTPDSSATAERHLGGKPPTHSDSARVSP